MDIKQMIRNITKNTKMIVNFPLIIFFVLYLFQLLVHFVITEGRSVKGLSLADVGMVILGLLFMFIIQMIPFLIVSAYCENLLKKGRSIKEIFIKMMCMTIPVSVLYFCLILIAIFIDTSSGASGWAMGIGFIAIISIPVVLVFGWILGQFIYEAYSKKFIE